LQIDHRQDFQPNPSSRLAHRHPENLGTLNFIFLANKDQSNNDGDNNNHYTRQQAVKEIG
jgi:hypothetical protein